MIEGYIIRPHVFIGCHEVLKELLQDLKDVKCRVWNGPDFFDVKERQIIGYEDDRYIDSDLQPWEYAEPIPTRRETILHVKKASNIVRWLESNDYYPDGYGNWYHAGQPASVWKASMFKYCGKPKPKDSGIVFLSDWLIAREVSGIA